jgi:hypothetical protein
VSDPIWCIRIQNISRINVLWIATSLWPRDDGIKVEMVSDPNGTTLSPAHA